MNQVACPGDRPSEPKLIPLLSFEQKSFEEVEKIIKSAQVDPGRIFAEANRCAEYRKSERNPRKSKIWYFYKIISRELP